MKQTAMAVVAAFLLAVNGTVTAGAQDVDIQALLKRIEQLEREVAELKATAPRTASPAPAEATAETTSGATEAADATGLEERLTRVEEAVAKDQTPETFRVFWKEGLNFESRNREFKMKVGGRIHNDWVFIASDDAESVVGELQDEVEFRRARIAISGTLYDNTEFKAEYDFANDGEANWKDVYLGLVEVHPWVGGIRIGHFKEPFGLEEMASSNQTTFLERNLANIFDPARNVGVMLHNAILTDDRITYAVGVFRDTTDDYGNFLDTHGGYAVTGRVTGLPYYADKGRRLVHLGLDLSHRSNNEDSIRYSQRPEVHTTPRFVDTGTFKSDSVDLLGLEAAALFGPLSIQSEYKHAFVDSDAGNDPEFRGGYVQVAYVLTGEHRSYRNVTGAFDRVRPRRNLNLADGGWGAWELAARYAHLDLDDGDIQGGVLEDLTLGLNWYLNPNTKILLNYIYAELDKDSETTDASFVTMRFQVDF